MTRLPALLLSLSLATPLAAQQPDFRWEKALAANSEVHLHNLNGDITVTPSTTGRVEIVGIKRGNRRYFEDVTVEIVETSRGIVVCPLFRNADMRCDEDGMNMRGRRGYRDDDYDDVSVEFDVKVPRNLIVRASSVSGDVTVRGAEGPVRAGSVSGDVRMEDLRATSVRASSVSGNVDVVILALTGEGDLRFSSVSGNVTAQLPRDVNADLSMSSVSGSLDSDFPLTLNGRMRRSSVEARIGRGGRDLNISTVSGDVRLRMPRQ